MPSQIPDEQLGEAVLKSVQHGVYPDSEEVISADIPASALPVVLGFLNRARDDIKVATCLATEPGRLANLSI
jgi:protein transport protein DSL1/ZW10